MPEFDQLYKLLRQPSTERGVVDFLNGTPVSYRKESGKAYATLRQSGIGVVFQEMGGHFEDTVIPDLRVCCIHFFSQDREGHTRYGGTLPGGVEFGDSLQTIETKLGPPMKTAAIDLDEAKNAHPPWIKYSIPHAEMHMELDTKGRLVMISLMPVPRL